VTLDSVFIRAIEAVAGVRLEEPLSRHTTIGIGGPADAYAIATSADQMQHLLDCCRNAGVPFFVLGSGSNIVVGDRGIRGLTIENNASAYSKPALTPALSQGERLEPSLSGFGADEQATIRRFRVRAETGASFALTSRQLAFAGFAGLEWACGIPGTIGGAVVYNAGAYGGCLGDALQRIAVWDTEDGVVEYAAAELGLVYRGSAFTKGLMAGRAVLWAEFDLWPGDAAELRARIADYDDRRLKAQPRGRNAGSFFKNPPGNPAWKLLDGVGLRGYQIGGARFSDKHCNFLINAGNASAADVAALKQLAQQRVNDEYGIELEGEVSFVGEGFEDEYN
jgi:UDP-N-acetylmuramate dehydrogenase